MRIDARTDAQYRAVLFALKSIDGTLRKMVRQFTKAIAAPEWSEALSRRASSTLERVVIVDTAVVTVSDQNVRIQSASKGRRRSGGLDPKTNWPAVEFGMNAQGSTYRRKSRNGGTHSITRVIGTAFKARNSRGYVFFPAAREMIPRIFALWAQTTVRTIGEALEGKQE